MEKIYFIIRQVICKENCIYCIQTNDIKSPTIAIAYIDIAFTYIAIKYTYITIAVAYNGITVAWYIAIAFTVW